MRIHGIVPPIITPMTSDGMVDRGSIERLVGHLLGAGVDGLFALGSSGETPYLTDGHRVAAVEALSGATGGQVPVLVGLLECSLPRAVEMIELFGRSKIDGIVATVPFYAMASDRELLSHFRGIAAAAPVPVVAYNIPSRTGARIPESVLLELLDEGTVTAVKDSSGDFSTFRSLVSKRPVGTAVMQGSDALVDVSFFVGADGAVPGMANVDPAGFVQLYRAAREGRWDDARAIQRRLSILNDTLAVGLNYGLGVDAAAYGAIKHALVLLGVIRSATTGKPQAALPEEATREVVSLLRSADVV